MPARSTVIAAWCLGACLNGVGQESFVRQANEYPVSGPLAGDQVQASVAVNSSGGILVWEDNFTDGDGSGVSARLLDGSFSGMLSSFRVNENAQGNQGSPEAAVLSDGGAVVVWAGGQPGFEDIYARFLSSSNTWITGDVLVSAYTNDLQEDPEVAALDNGESVVVWASYNQAGATSMKDVYLQRFSAGGQKLGGTLLVNQVTALNQRSPSVCRLSDGRFVVGWVGETRLILGGTNEVYNVDVYGRVFSASGVAQGNQFKMNASSQICANPSLAAAGNGGFLAAWSQKDLSSLSNSWDVASRYFSSAGAGGAESLLNTYRYGDQFGPSAAAVGDDFMVVWTSLRQDGSHEGVFGRFVGPAGLPSGEEFQVNTTAASKQILPHLASDGNSRFLAVWSGFTGVAKGFDVFGQRYALESEPLIAPEAPYVWVLSDSEIKVSWATLSGFAVANYEVYADGAASATWLTTNNWWNVAGLGPGTTHSYRLAYVLQDGRRSPLSASSSGTTYLGIYYFGIPVEWMSANWGQNWPGVSVDSDGDGASNGAEFLAGTDPNDASSVLRTSLTYTPQGYFLKWNTEPGRIYQVQQSTDFNTWTELGGPRFAPGDVDSVNVGGGGFGLFRVVLLRN